MSHPDDSIDRVLGALRDAEPPEGMERRILQAAQHHSSDRRAWWPMHLSIPAPRIPTHYRVVGLACLAIASSLLVWNASRPSARSHTAPAEDSRSTHANLPEQHPSRQAPTTIQPASQPVSQPTIIARQERTSLHPSQSTRKERLVTLRDIRSGNHPAPEAPLTGQEKLLLRLAHRSDPQEIALLNPSLWAARDAKEKEEVKKFFEPPPTGDDQ
jgi:hypothetical protein